MRRCEVAIRVLWPLVWGVGVCAGFVALVSFWDFAAASLRGWLGLAVIIGVLLVLELIGWVVRKRVRPSVCGVDLLSPELSAERFLGVVAVLVLLIVVASVRG